MEKVKKGDYIVVATELRGVFAGEFVTREGAEATIRNARMCVAWPASVHGFTALAACGPLQGSRVSLAAPLLVITKVSAIMVCSAAARAQWEKSLWS